MEKSVFWLPLGPIRRPLQRSLRKATMESLQMKALVWGVDMDRSMADWTGGSEALTLHRPQCTGCAPSLGCVFLFMIRLKKSHRIVAYHWTL